MYVASIHLPYAEACAAQVVVEWIAKRRKGVVEVAVAGCIWRPRCHNKIDPKILEMTGSGPNGEEMCSGRERRRRVVEERKNRSPIWKSSDRGPSRGVRPARSIFIHL